MRTNYKAVLFDLDGTLLDTAPEFVAVVNQLRHEHQLPPMESDIIRDKVSHGARALVTLALGLYDRDEIFEDALQRLLELYTLSLGEYTQFFPGITKLLHWLLDQGMDWGICTNKPSYLTLPLIQKMNFSRGPKTVVCPDHVSKTKPNPEPLLLNCKHLNCQPHQVIYIGDHLRDIQAGNSAGMYTIAAGYGYLSAEDNPSNWLADDIVNRSLDLQKLIKALL